jgi:hypothetical protein
LAHGDKLIELESVVMLMVAWQDESHHTPAKSFTHTVSF